MTKPAQPTPEQIAAREAARAFFGDLLTPAPKGGKPARAKSAASDRRRTSGPPPAVDPQRSPIFVAERYEYRIIEQRCTTCGAVHEYAASQMIRFAARRRKDNLYITQPCALPPGVSLPEPLDLPELIIREYETTPFCPSCVETARSIEAICLGRNSAQQMELFK
jgi:hypothetical protein